MRKFQLTDETIAYVTAENQTNTDDRHLVAGSKNVIIDDQRKVRTRHGFSRFGVANDALTKIRNSVVWNTSTGNEYMIRGYDDELEIYLGTIDGVEINAFTRIANGWSTTPKPRFTTWFDTGENLDLLIFVWGDDNLYEWGGGVAVVDSITATTITKKSTDTFAQARFYTTGSKTVVCVRTGTEYTYTGGETTTTLTGIADTTGLIDGDILVQKVVTQSNKPAQDRNNHTIFTFENQICVGSDDDQEVYVSQNDDYADFTSSAPRVPGEGELLTLDNPASGFAELVNKLVIFAGKSSIYQAEPYEITVGSTLAETFKVKKYQTGVNQGAQSQEVITEIGSTIVYLSHEPALRELVSLEEISGGGQPRTLSNPIQPDFDSETWTDAAIQWHRNNLYLSAPTNGRVYILTYDEDADGTLRRFWQPPQTGMSISSFSTYAGLLYGHSFSVAETYKLFDTDMYSDINSDDEKIAIPCVAKYAYRNYGDRAQLKNFDEYFVEGEVRASTEIKLTLNYDFGGTVLSTVDYIDGANSDILSSTLQSVSLGQTPLGQTPLGGAVNVPEDAAKYRAIIEKAKEDFFELQAVFETDDTDKYFAILAHGPNAQISTRQPITHKI